MGDCIKINKDKRHRSSSSLAGVVLDGTRSERKLDIRTSIPEADDQFALAESRCDDLQAKIDLVKVLKRKKKNKRRSTTRVNEQQVDETVPLITVRTQPKKTLPVKEAAQSRVRRELPRSTLRYLDPATLEQQRMLGHVRGSRPHEQNARRFRSRAEGDIGPGMQVSDAAINVACGDDRAHEEGKIILGRHMPGMLPTPGTFSPHRKLIRRQVVNDNYQNTEPIAMEPKLEARKSKPAVVELFKSRGGVADGESRNHNKPHRRAAQNISCEIPYMNNTQEERKVHSAPRRRVRYRCRGYEQPTVASRMKQSGVKYYYGDNCTRLPFVVSKSTAPSHNIGVNLQQVLSGVKNQQPLSGIPLTIAHHMGLGHIPVSLKSDDNSMMFLDNREINAIKVGQKLLRLPSYNLSYNRILTMYREGEGIVPRFLRAVNRPHYFYTSMYNLPTNRDDLDAATSKGRAVHRQDSKLAEFADLYREFVHIDKCIKDGDNGPELERRKEELTKELAAREENVRQIIRKEYRPGEGEPSVLRASASAADDGYRHSTFKLSLE